MRKTMEVWKNIKNSEGIYQVSSFGRVRNTLTGKMLSPSLGSNGYTHVDLRYGINKTMSVHRLVAEAFVPNLQNLPIVNHKDENRLNNNMENLEWCTCQHNVTYGKGAKVRNHPVLQKSLDEIPIKIWDSMKEAAESLNLYYQGISSCCRGIKKSCGGFHWEYIQKEMRIHD